MVLSLLLSPMGLFALLMAFCFLFGGVASLRSRFHTRATVVAYYLTQGMVVATIALLLYLLRTTG